MAQKHVKKIKGPGGRKPPTKSAKDRKLIDKIFRETPNITAAAALVKLRRMKKIKKTKK